MLAVGLDRQRKQTAVPVLDTDSGEVKERKVPTQEVADFPESCVASPQKPEVSLKRRPRLVSVAVPSPALYQHLRLPQGAAHVPG